MATYNFDNKIITSDGTFTTLSNDNVRQTFSFGAYTASTPLTTTTYTNANLHFYSDTMNLDIKGNAQENFAGHGETSEYTLKVVGTPEQFQGNAQRGADESVVGFISLLLNADDRKFSRANPLTAINPVETVSNMSSDFQSSFIPDLPPIRHKSDIPISSSKLQAHGASAKLSDTTEQSKRASQLTTESNERKVKYSIEAGRAVFGEAFNPTNASAAPTATDVRNFNFVPKQTYHTELYTVVNKLFAYERKI